jgi:hypothetical protein
LTDLAEQEQQAVACQMVLEPDFLAASLINKAIGIYQLFALQIPSLQDAPGFPVLIDGHNADNDRTRYFVGGTVLQRPSLTIVNGMILAGFGGVSV